MKWFTNNESFKGNEDQTFITGQITFKITQTVLMIILATIAGAFGLSLGPSLKIENILDQEQAANVNTLLESMNENLTNPNQS